MKKKYYLPKVFVVFLLLIVLVGCSIDTDSPKELKHTANDPHSFARPNEAVVKHLDLDVVVDFEAKKISGQAKLRIENKRGTNELYLDTRDLTIEKVTLGENDRETNFTLSEPVEFLGQALIVAIEPQTQFVTVYYSTSPQAAALQWLEPQQTTGGKHQFLFTQSEAILARTWIPIQDSPGIRMTYSARITVPKELMAVMSAENPTSLNPEGVYEFNMPQPIPAYLLALAVGDLEFRATGERTGVYAEPEVVEKATWEFADTEKMIVAAEQLYGPYRWGRYDIIVLPPSFPFGGMENPRLTFVTPTVLAGDRSLTSLVAHELAHSWSGNLVTAATWNDFWLNEGFTVYFEHRIDEKVYGTDYDEMLSVLELRELKQDIQEIGPESADTHLFLNLAGRDPDEGMTLIAYDKGHFFLRLVEETVGRQRFDAFLRDYFNQFAFESMTTEKFVTLLRDKLLQGDQELEQKIDINAWVYGPGLPDNVPNIQSTALQQVDSQAEAFVTGTPAQELQIDGWTTQHWLRFLPDLSEPLSHDQMAELDAAFHFTQSGNSEILFDWLLQAIANNYEPAYPALEDFLTRQGRRKFLKPLYAKMAETPEGKKMALEIYKETRPTYHSVSARTIDKILGWGQSLR
jgi:leukotriene A-4 hydrolase/aminopeptidase